MHEPTVQRIVAAAGLTPGETVLDLGAGPGALSLPCARAVEPGGRVVAVEVAPGALRQLRSLARPSLDVVAGDALDVPLPRVDAVVANPPFRIAAPLVRRMLGVALTPDAPSAREAVFGRAVLVLPRELVERLVARPGTERYGRLTVEVALRAATRRLFAAPSWAFDPPPAVGVDVARLDPLPFPTDLDPGVLDRVLAAAWQAPRRTMRHALGGLATAMRVSSGEVTSALRDLDLEERTPREVEPAEYTDLAVAVQALVARRA